MIDDDDFGFVLIQGTYGGLLFVDPELLEVIPDRSAYEVAT